MIRRSIHVTNRSMFKAACENRKINGTYRGD